MAAARMINALPTYNELIRQEIQKQMTELKQQLREEVYRELGIITKSQILIEKIKKK